MLNKQQLSKYFFYLNSPGEKKKSKIVQSYKTITRTTEKVPFCLLFYLVLFSLLFHHFPPSTLWQIPLRQWYCMLNIKVGQAVFVYSHVIFNSYVLLWKRKQKQFPNNSLHFKHLSNRVRHECWDNKYEAPSMFGHMPNILYAAARSGTIERLSSSSFLSSFILKTMVMCPQCGRTAVHTAQPTQEA